jgi:hypothetical protein
LIESLKLKIQTQKEKIVQLEQESLSTFVKKIKEEVSNINYSKFVDKKTCQLMLINLFSQIFLKILLKKCHIFIHYYED